MSSVRRIRAQRGTATLLDLMITLILIGIATIVVSGKTSIYRMYATSAERANQELMIRTIGGSLMQYAASVDGKGRLPAPYTGGGYFSAPVDPANTALVQLVNGSNVTSRLLNDDGKVSKQVRTYQLDAGRTATMPLYASSGPQVILTYDVGVLYQTACAKGTGCATQAVPGVSAAFTESVASTWTTVYPDYGSQQLSSLPIQMQKLKETARRLDRIRDGLMTSYRAASIAAAANDLSNYYPPVSGGLGGQTPGANQGCRDGWYPLDSAGGYSSILSSLGLASGEYGVTDWGGRIELCRKYDPAGTGTETAPPHYAALRINRNVTAGLSPSSVASDNAILTF
jgi:hypothetical protein